MMEQIHLLILGIILFCVGLYALLGKRNVIKILMGIEIMTIAINVVFIALGSADFTGDFYSYRSSCHGSWFSNSHQQL